MFDLGGVILDLAGLRAFLDRHGFELRHFQRLALGGGAHQRFERGSLGADEYARAFLDELGLELTTDEFLADFESWPGALLPGAAELLADVAVTKASLSNTNPIHWGSEFNRDAVMPLFDRHFPSYELRLAKPDRAIFERVAELLAVAPGRTVFFDDNQVNVDSAADVGFVAHRVTAPSEAREILDDLGVLRSR